MDPRYVKLCTAAHALAVHYPEAWRSFMVNLSSITELEMQKLLKSPHTEVHRLQGRAGALEELVRMLTDPEKTMASSQPTPTAKTRGIP